MTDPIDEAAARAIYESMQLKRGWDDPKLNDAWKPVCLRNARACRLAILRGMLERPSTDATWAPEPFASAWRAMLRAEIDSLDPGREDHP